MDARLEEFCKTHRMRVISLTRGECASGNHPEVRANCVSGFGQLSGGRGGRRVATGCVVLLATGGVGFP